MPTAKVEQTHWGFEETPEEKRGLLERLRRRREPRRATVEEMGGPEPLPLVGGRFAGADLSLSAHLGADQFIIPGHDPGAVESMRRKATREPDLHGRRSPFADPRIVAAQEPEIAGVGVQRSPFV